MNDSIKERTRNGVVTFLDVLGWKGIYDRQANAIDTLSNIVNGVKTRADKFRGSRGIIGDVTIKSISDTIAIFTFSRDKDPAVAIEIHGELCQWLIPESIKREIPMRGATAFGEFDIGDNIFVGKAVDEAASWHEHSDWIGVHLTPSAEFFYNPTKNHGIWARYNAPNKTRLNWNPYCVNWTNDWKDRAQEVDRIKAKFHRLGPIVPEITGKFINTLDFIKKMESSKAS